MEQLKINFEIQECEIWKDIFGYEGLYQISSLGRVKSLYRIVKRGNSPHTIVERILRHGTSKIGYPAVAFRKDSKTKSHFIHILLGIHFIDKDYLKKGLTVNHKNGNRADYRLSNLEIVSHSENTKHAIHVLGKKIGGGQPLKPIIQYSLDGEFIAEWASTKAAEETLKISDSSISRALTGAYKKAGGYKWKFLEQQKYA